MTEMHETVLKNLSHYKKHLVDMVEQNVKFDLEVLASGNHNYLMDLLIERVFKKLF